MNHLQYLSDTSWTRSIFFDSQMTIAGKWVSQSRYDVSTTKLIALCWNASRAELISNADPTQDRITQANQNSLSMIWLFGSTTNLMPCKDEFSKYSRNMSLHLGGAISITVSWKFGNGNECIERSLFNLYEKCPYCLRIITNHYLLLLGEWIMYYRFHLTFNVVEISADKSNLWRLSFTCFFSCRFFGHLLFFSW